MRCSNIIVPGMAETSKIKNPCLDMFLMNSFNSKDEALDEFGITPGQAKKWADEQQGHAREYNSPKMSALAEQRAAGNVSDEQWVEAVRENNAPKPFANVQDVPSYKELVMALRTPEKGVINTGSGTKNMKKLPEGMPVASRLDIPAYKDNDTWVVTLHTPSKGRAGKVIGYAKSAHLKNVVFQDGARQMKGAMKIAAGGAKFPMATFTGNWTNTNTNDVVAQSEEALASAEWVQIGMNPDRGEFFYDKNGFRPVASAEEVLQVGSLLMARGVVYSR
jgi:hypothetical protein